MTDLSATIVASAGRAARPLMLRVALWLGAGTLALGLALAATAQLAKLHLAAAHPPPGKLIDIGSHALHLNCVGEGVPTVVLEAGNADFSLLWSKVQPALATAARVCAYDRAGLGWSEPSPAPRTVATMTAELEALLDAAGEAGPYVLVGHSFGGILVRAFAAAHRNEVAGIVLVDSAHPAQAGRLPGMDAATGRLAAQFEGLMPLVDWGILAVMPEAIPDPGLDPAALDHYRARLASSGYFAVAAAESRALKANLSEFVDDPLGDLPLAVISRGRADPLPGLSPVGAQAYEDEWKAMQAELGALSTHASHAVAAESGHMIPLQAPELVVDAVRRLMGTLH